MWPRDYLAAMVQLDVILDGAKVVCIDVEHGPDYSRLRRGATYFAVPK